MILTPVAQRIVSWHGLRLGCVAWLLVSGCQHGQVAVKAADPGELKQLRARSHQKGMLLRFEGPIGRMLPQYLRRQLDRARKAEADLVVVEIDSPGGELEASFACAELLRGVTWADLVVHVPRQAYSGAAIAALGAKTIAIGPKAKFGDAGPIFMGEDALFRHAPEKIRSALAGRIRDLADSTGRPGTMAHAMVDMDWVVYRVKHRGTDEETWMSDEEIASSKEPDQWEKLGKVDESREGYFLTVSGSRAVELTLADFVTGSRDQLRRELKLKGEWIEVSPNWVDTLVVVLNIPFVTGILFVLGVIALFVEFSAPGIGVGGLTSFLCMSLFFWSRFLGGTAGWLEVLLFMTGIVFLLIEVLVIPGFGVAGLGGVFLLFGSVLMACQTHLVPATPEQWAETGQWLLVLFVSSTICLAGAVVMLQYASDIPLLKRFVAVPVPDERGASEYSLTAATLEAGSSDQSSAALSLGAEGTADCALRPSGKMNVEGHLFNVVTDGEFVDAGQRVRVVEIRGSHIVVRSLQSLSGD